MDILAILAGLGTGFVLGLLGSGGSIIALPALLYLLHVEPKSAIAMSLGVVAVTATLAALGHVRRGNVDLKIALVFASFGALGTFMGTRVGVAIPAAVQLSAFALVMYAAAWRMQRKPASSPSSPGGRGGSEATPGCEHYFSTCMAYIVLAGIAVGLLTGVVGVGGGFLIVPALVLLSRVPIKQAVATSLAIVSANSSVGFAGYLGSVPISWGIMAGFTAVTVVGSFAGARFSNRLSQETLKRSFAWFLVVVATYILFKNVIATH
ncbi:MAG: sulfite exporter TauE/SafE family protein [Betaproteobacteria bacterium]|nr:sulfite exporter TauE/SafE family protein [Betaproteobacteria bacterium]